MASYQKIVQLFVLFLSRDAQLLGEIEAFSGECAIKNTEWHFTLPALHEFIQGKDAGFSEMDYPAFRHLIFNNPINQDLTKQGGEVVIAENHYKVDQSVYAVRKINQSS